MIAGWPSLDRIAGQGAGLNREHCNATATQQRPIIAIRTACGLALVSHVFSLSSCVSQPGYTKVMQTSAQQDASRTGSVAIFWKIKPCIIYGSTMVKLVCILSFLLGKKGFVIRTKSFVKIGIAKIFYYNNKMFSSINKTFGCCCNIFG